MRDLRLLTLALVLGLLACGCEKKEPPTETTEKAETEKEAVMGITIQWLGHASFKICCEETVIYIDPWKIKEAAHDATVVLVSHSHHDHYSTEDIAKVSGANTKLIASADVMANENKGQAIAPGQTIELEDLRIRGVAAYNPNKQFHPKENNWVGFIIEVGSKRIYYAGDTDLTDEMKALKDIDVALLPVGGTYTMDGEQAAEAAGHIKPKQAIPYHWGEIVGSRNDAEKFAEMAQCEVKIMSPGEIVTLQ